MEPDRAIAIPAELTEPAPQTPWTPTRIAQREESRVAYALGSIAPVAREWEGGVIAAGPKDAWVNQTNGVGLNGEAPDAHSIAEMRDFYTARGLLPRIELAPIVPRVLLDRLSDAGFRATRFESILACDPRSWREPDRWTMPPGLRIRRLTPDECRMDRSRPTAAFASTLMESAINTPAAADTTASEVSIELAQRAMAFEHAITLIAEIDDQPAGVAMMDVFPGITALYFGATDPRFRRRGIQSAMIIERLRIARERGIPLATIGSDPGGPTERNALRMRMDIAYTKTAFVCPPM
ncbi:MAG: GNAT family N-acetyltransferase [Phycisphaerales bacterium]